MGLSRTDPPPPPTDGPPRNGAGFPQESMGTGPRAYDR